MNILVVIDVQRQFYKEIQYEKIVEYINNNKQYYDKVIVTVFKNSKTSNFVKQLSYNDCLDNNIDDLDFNTEKLYYL